MGGMSAVAAAMETAAATPGPCNRARETKKAVLKLPETAAAQARNLSALLRGRLARRRCLHLSHGSEKVVGAAIVALGISFQLGHAARP